MTPVPATDLPVSDLSATDLPVSDLPVADLVMAELAAADPPRSSQAFAVLSLPSLVRWQVNRQNTAHQIYTDQVCAHPLV